MISFLASQAKPSILQFVTSSSRARAIEQCIRVDIEQPQLAQAQLVYTPISICGWTKFQITRYSLKNWSKCKISICGWPKLQIAS
jgi:hypothetical protein